MRILAQFFLASTIFSSAAAFAAATPEQLVDITKVAVDKFLRDNPSQRENLFGYKVWQAGHDVKAKIYIQQGGTSSEVNYTCHNHDGLYECHDQ